MAERGTPEEREKARSKDATPEELATLSHHPNPRIRCAVAWNENTHRVTRIKLATDPNIDVALAAIRSKPRLSLEEVLFLVEEMRNTEASLKDTFWKTEIENTLGKRLAYLATEAPASDDLLARELTSGVLSYHGDGCAARVLTRKNFETGEYPNLGPLTLTAAAQHSDIWVRVNAIENPRCPDAALTDAAINGIPLIRTRVATRISKIPVEAFSALVRDRSSKIREYALSMHRELIAETDRDTLLHICRTTYDRSILEEYANDPDEDMQTAVSLNKAAPRSILERLSTSPSSVVRKNLATRGIQLDQLINDDDAKVRAAAAVTAPWGIAQNLVSDPDPKVRISLLKHPHIDSATIDLLGNDPDPKVTTAAARMILKTLSA